MIESSTSIRNYIEQGLKFCFAHLRNGLSPAVSNRTFIHEYIRTEMLLSGGKFNTKTGPLPSHILWLQDVGGLLGPVDSSYQGAKFCTYPDLPSHPLTPRCRGLPEGESEFERGNGFGITVKSGHLVQGRFSFILNVQYAAWKRRPALLQKSKNTWGQHVFRHVGNTCSVTWGQHVLRHVGNTCFRRFSFAVSLFHL